MKWISCIIKQLSKLPLSVLYIFSDIIFYLIYYVMGYRKKEVFQNIKNSFPEKSEQEIQQIQRQFFKNFSDYIIETFKAISISENELRVRVQHINQHLFEEVQAEKKNIILLTGHIFNWEWINALARIIPQKNCHPVYKKINNKFWEEQVLNIRNKFGNISLEINELPRHILKTPNNGETAYMFVADQSPHISQVDVGITFLNQKTPVYIGYDKLSKLDLAFIYCDIKKVKRGYYQVNYYRIYPDNKRFKPFEVVLKFHKLLEKTIRKDPANYLWSHKRWKNAHAIKQEI